MQHPFRFILGGREEERRHTGEPKQRCKLAWKCRNCAGFVWVFYQYFNTSTFGGFRFELSRAYIAMLLLSLPMKNRKCCIISDTFDTHSSLVCGVTDTDCRAQTGSTRGPSTPTFKRQDKKSREKLVCYVFLKFHIPFLCVMPLVLLLFSSALNTALEYKNILEELSIPHCGIDHANFVMLICACLNYWYVSKC